MRGIFQAALGLLALSFPLVALGQDRSGPVEYKDRDTVLEGYLAVPKDVGTARPGVLVIPDWMGVSDHYRRIADRLAAMGYVALVVDMYGKDTRPKNGEEAAVLAAKYKSDRKFMRERGHAALEELKKNPFVDQGRVAAIGYCFGGTGVLELARSGAPLVGVVSFHGGLDTPNPADAGHIKGSVLACHGADDPFVPPAEVAAFQDEMRKANVDWQMVIYGNAVHSFTTPAAGNDPSKGVAYNAKADTRSWEAMKLFFNEIFQAGK
jgi:dienelactone hydrolase